MNFEYDELIAAILALGVAKRTEENSPSAMVKHYDAVREELRRMRDAKSRRELEEWDRHAHLETD